jgi:hypothetical protein
LRHKLVLESKKLKHKVIPSEDLNVVYYQGEDWDITIGDDDKGNPYISIALGNPAYELVETKPSWKGKILKILLNDGYKAALSEMREKVKKLRQKFVDAFLYADRFYEKNELQAIIKNILDEWEKETFGDVLK